MHDKVETILLQKVGTNRKNLEALEAKLDSYVARLDSMEKRISNLLITLEAMEVGDREAELRGE